MNLFLRLRDLPTVKTVTKPRLTAPPTVPVSSQISSHTRNLESGAYSHSRYLQKYGGGGPKVPSLTLPVAEPHTGDEGAPQVKGLEQARTRPARSDPEQAAHVSAPPTDHNNTRPSSAPPGCPSLRCSLCPGPRKGTKDLPRTGPRSNQS